MIERTLQAGDTWDWTEVDTEAYPAPTWVLHLTGKNAAGGFQLNSVASGAAHRISVVWSQTQAIPPGEYEVNRWVESGPERITLDGFRLTVLPDPRKSVSTAPLAMDRRTHVKQTLAALEATLLGKASKDQLAYQIAGRSLSKFQPSELLAWRDKYVAELKREEAAEKLNAGLSGGGRLLVRG